MTSEEVSSIMSESRTFRDIVNDELSRISLLAPLGVPIKLVGIPDPKIKNTALDKVDAALMSGNLISAIKEFRTIFDAGLADSKNWCHKREELLRSGALSSNSAEFLVV